MSNFLKWLAEFLGNIRGGSSSVVGRWNPIPIGMYSDLIIQQMGATPAQIQKHIDRVAFLLEHLECETDCYKQ